MTEETQTEAASVEAASEPSNRSLVTRGLFGGLLMGLANLVPGISGGTMLVAAGVYQRFIEAIAELTRLTFRKRSILLLCCVVAAAGCAILCFAGPVKGLVVDHRFVMYSLFIGLTLGGLPVIYRMLGQMSRDAWVGAACGFVGMALVAWMQMHQPDSAAAESFGMFLLAGVLGASAMILPGISGGYLLLVLGAYVPVLGAIDQVKVALKARDLQAIWEPGLHIILPVGLGVLLGVVVVANLLRFLLRRFERPTLGVLLGLLVGAVLGLYPFQKGVAPEVGSLFKGQTVTAELLSKLTPDKYPTEFYTPGAVDVLLALGLIAVGFGITVLVARLGRDRG